MKAPRVMSEARLCEIRSIVANTNAWEGPTRDAMDELLDELDSLLRERLRLIEAVRIASLQVANDALLTGDIHSAERRLTRVKAALRGATQADTTTRRSAKSRAPRAQKQGTRRRTRKRTPHLVLVPNHTARGPGKR